MRRWSAVAVVPEGQHRVRAPARDGAFRLRHLHHVSGPGAGVDQPHQAFAAITIARRLRLLALARRAAVAAVQLLSERTALGELLLAEGIEGLAVALSHPRARLRLVQAEPGRKLEHLAPHLLELLRGGRRRAGGGRSAIAAVVQAVAELVAEVAQRPFEGVGHRTLVGGLVGFRRLAGDEGAADIARAGSRER